MRLVHTPPIESARRAGITLSTLKRNPRSGGFSGQALYGAFEVKHMFYTTLYFLYSSFFVRLGIPFLRPDPHVLRPTRTGPVKVGRRSALAARSVVSRPRL